MALPVTPLRLRRCAAGDLDSVMDIERGPGFEAYVGRSPRPEHEDMLASPRYAYLIGERRDEAIGFALLRDLEDPYGNVYLKRIAVRRPGQGDGAALLAAVLDWAFAQTRAHRFHLDCLDDNVRAQALYAKLGFTRDGVLRQAYLDPQGRRRDLVLMAILRSEWEAQKRALPPGA